MAVESSLRRSNGRECREGLEPDLSLACVCSGAELARTAPEVNQFEFSAEHGFGTLQKQQESEMMKQGFQEGSLGHIEGSSRDLWYLRSHDLGLIRRIRQ